MPPDATLQITIEDDQARFVRKLVSTGQYSGEREVVEAGLSRLQEEDDTRERWMREVAVPAHQRIVADPSIAVPLEDVEIELAADRKHLLEGR